LGEGLKFVVDSMHGTLARKLRIFGFDTVHDQLSDDTLLEIGRRERRVIVTSDRDLHRTAQKNGLNSVLLECENDEDRIFTLFKRLHVKVEH
jgi:uncharacterized protein with PIN domain